MEKSVRLYHWLPRVICILAILFITLLSLNSYQYDSGFLASIGSLIKQLFPSLAFIAILIVAWRWELIGGIIFTTIGLMLSPYIFIHNYNANLSFWRSLLAILLIILPFVIIGVLFIVSFFQKKKHQFFNLS